MIDKLPPHNPEPAYLRGLIDKIGISQRGIAKILQITPQIFRMYITDKSNLSYKECPYKVQLCLEYLVLIAEGGNS